MDYDSDEMEEMMMADFYGEPYVPKGYRSTSLGTRILILEKQKLDLHRQPNDKQTFSENVQSMIVMDYSPMQTIRHLAIPILLSVCFENEKDKTTRLIQEILSQSPRISQIPVMYELLLYRGHNEPLVNELATELDKLFELLNDHTLEIQLNIIAEYMKDCGDKLSKSLVIIVSHYRLKCLK